MVFSCKFICIRCPWYSILLQIILWLRHCIISLPFPLIKNSRWRPPRSLACLDHGHFIQYFLVNLLPFAVRCMVFLCKYAGSMVLPRIISIGGLLTVELAEFSCN